MFRFLNSPEAGAGGGTGSETDPNSQTGKGTEQNPKSTQENHRKYSAVRAEERNRIYGEFSDVLKDLGIDADGDPISALKGLKREIETDGGEEVSKLRETVENLQATLANERRSSLIRSALADKGVSSVDKVTKYFSVDFDISETRDGVHVKSKDDKRIVFSREDPSRPATVAEAVSYFLEDNPEHFKAEARAGVSGPRRGSIQGEPKTPDEFFAKVLRGS